MSNDVQSYRDLKVWQKARLLVTTIYQLSASFPREELYGLTSQIRRASISVPSNIAEGSAKGSTREFIRFVGIAYGSLAEIETQLFLATDLKYITDEALQTALVETAEIGRMLNGLQRSLETKITELRTLTTGH